jgi:peroxiredoxin family protein
MSTETVSALENQLSELRARVAQLEAANRRADRLAMVVFSGSLDRQLAAFTMATAAAACGMEVLMFFTFWGLSALRDPSKQSRSQSLLSALFGIMLPRGTLALPLSQWNFAGIGSRLLRNVMSNQKLTSLEEMFALSHDMDINLYACDMSMRTLGISADELIAHPKLSICGATLFIERASAGKLTLFV